MFKKLEILIHTVVIFLNILIGKPFHYNFIFNSGGNFTTLGLMMPG